MARSLTMIITFIAAASFWKELPLLRLFDAFQPMTTALSIFIAAVLVRLNRGMPTIEWKSADPEKREMLTARILSVSKEYALILLINAILLLFIMTLTVVGKQQIAFSWPEWFQKASAGFVGGAAVLCICRVGYVVWRDIDIVALQKTLIDGTASRDFAQEQADKADQKIASIRSAGVRKVDVKAPKVWGE